MNSKNKIKFLSGKFLSASQSPIILGGHFALVNDPQNPSTLIPGIFQDCENTETKQWMKDHPYMSHFPVETFDVSLDLLIEHQHSKFLMLVNDWQHVTDTKLLKKELRANYYAKNTLPKLFEAMIVNKGLSTADRILYPLKEDLVQKSIFWSEVRLRNKFSTRSVYKSCPLKNGCAQEFSPLLDSCEERRVDKMLAFIPATCAYPIMDAVNEFKKARFGKMDIMTIFISNSLSLENFWDATISFNGEIV